MRYRGAKRNIILIDCPEWKTAGSSVHLKNVDFCRWGKKKDAVCISNILVLQVLFRALNAEREEVTSFINGDRRLHNSLAVLKD